MDSGASPAAAGRALPSCAICKRDITTVGIACCDCSNTDLCIECFAIGAEAPELPHKSTHRYRVHENLTSFCLYDRDWTAEEELLLLQGIDMYGMANWRDIANFMTSKSEAQVQRHYIAVYLESPTAPLPSGSPTVAATMRPRTDLGPLPLHPTAGGLSGGTDGAAAVSGPEESTTVTAAAAGRPSGGAASGRGGGGGGGTGTPGYSHAHIPRTEVAGYLPLRGDFDVEHDNDAEMILADMEFTEGEHATETELKLKVLEIYNAKLDERERRKAFVLERGLLDYKRLLAVERRRPREERDVYDAFRPFARFLTPVEFEELVRGIILEHRIRRRIAQLQELRRAGVRSLADAAEYEAAKRKREAAIAARRGGAGGTAASGPPGADAGGPFTIASYAAASGGGRGDDLLYGGVSSRAVRYSSRGAAGSSASGGADAESGQAATSSSAPTTIATDAALAAASTASGGGGTKRRRRGAVGDDDAQAVAATAPVALSSAAGAPSAGTSSSVNATAQALPPFSLHGIPGADRLSGDEVRLCEHLRLLPHQYAQIKATLVNIALVRGNVKKTDAAGLLIHVDAAKLGGVFDFAVSAGWIPAKQES